MTKEKLMEITTEEILGESLKAKPLDGETPKIKKDEKEVKQLNHTYKAKTFGSELTGKENVSSEAKTLIEINEIKNKNIEETNKSIKEKSVKEKPEDNFLKSEVVSIVEKKQELQAPNNLKIIYKPEAWNKIVTWVNMTDKEISGMGCVKRQEDGSFYVYDVFLIKQENTGSFTDIDDESLMSLMWELTELDDKNGSTFYDDLKYWWHSHAHMGTFWSGQDESCIKQKLEHANWWLSTVHNKKGECTTRYDIANPPTQFNDLKLEISREIPESIKEFCRKEYEEKVTEKKYEQISNAYSYDNRFLSLYPQYNRNKRIQTGKTTTTQARTQTTQARTQTTQAKTQTNQANKTLIETLAFAQIPTPNENTKLFNTTPSKAKVTYDQEIKRGQLYLSDRMKELDVTDIEFTGYAFHPRASDDTKGTIEWTVSGSIGPGNNLNKFCYMLVVWHEEEDVVFLTRITQAKHRNQSNVILMGCQFTVPLDKFINLSLQCSPDPIAIEANANQNNLEPCVGIIFNTTVEINQLQLGQDFLDTDFSEEEILGEVVDISEITKTNPDEPEEECKHDLFNELKNYANRTSPKSLEARIFSTIKNSELRVLADILSILVSNMSEDADEKALEEDAEHMTKDLLLAYIEIFVRRDARKAFPLVWNIIPYMYICSLCFEPTTEEAIKCTYCKADLPELEE